MKPKPWPDDAPDGKTWECPDCKSRATLGGNAGFHRDTERHAEPVLVDMNPQPKPDTISRSLLLALEFGYKQCEKGNNLQMAIQNFKAVRGGVKATQ